MARIVESEHLAWRLLCLTTGPWYISIALLGDIKRAVSLRANQGGVDHIQVQRESTFQFFIWLVS